MCVQNCNVFLLFSDFLFVQPLSWIDFLFHAINAFYSLLTTVQEDDTVHGMYLVQRSQKKRKSEFDSAPLSVFSEGVLFSEDL